MYAAIGYVAVYRPSAEKDNTISDCSQSLVSSIGPDNDVQAAASGNLFVVEGALLHVSVPAAVALCLDDVTHKQFSHFLHFCGCVRF